MAYKKLVHWESEEPSISDLNSICFDESDISAISTSSLEYVNAQLVAHGYVPSPGLCLDGVSNEDSSRLVKCLLNLLSQRMEDMSRTEDLTAKCRTMTYDIERLRSLHRAETENAANAEREANLHKSRLAASVKSLQASENSHKQTTAELQRTRTLLQGIRATHQTELKKKDKEVERVIERWQKLAEQQSKLSATPSGMSCLNTEAVDGTTVGRGPGFLDIALEDSERARNHLTDENLFLRKLVLKTANQLHTLIHRARSSGDIEGDEPMPFSMSTLFPIAPPSAPSDKVNELLSTFRKALSTLETSQAVPPLKVSTPPGPDSGEVRRLEGVITKLRDELDQTRKQAATQMSATQAMFDKFAKDHRLTTSEVGEMSMELISAPEQDEEKMRLEQLRLELDQERLKFTQSAINLGKEKASLEAERLKLLDEKRSWEVTKMLSDMPPTPDPISPPRPKPSKPSSPAKAAKHSRKHSVSVKSPRKSPLKQNAVGKVGSGRKAHRVSRTSLGSPNKVTSYETELVPPLAAPSFTLSAPSTASSLLPTSFVLPPPSPRASLPTQPALPPARLSSGNEISSKHLPPTLEVSPPPEDTSPSTPPRSPYPVAKPFAQRMIHAYSPARPSPLSRILMLSASPPVILSGDDASLSPSSGSVPMEGDSADSFERAVMGIPSASSAQQVHSTMSLAVELGVTESPPDTPLQEKKIEPNVRGGKVLKPEPKEKQSARPVMDKGKAKAEPVARPKSSLGKEKEKENSATSRRVVVSKVSSSTTSGGGGLVRKVLPPVSKPAAKSTAATKPITTTASTTASSRARTIAKPPVPGGPQRILIDSADAPVGSKTRKK